jgi:hypothetical protein
MSGLARELYVVNQLDAFDVPRPNAFVTVAKGIFGGDFNLSVVDPDWTDNYRFFRPAFSANMNGGAFCDEVPIHTDPDDDRRTTVQIVEGAAHDQPIWSPLTTRYLSYKIDLLFFRRGSGVTAERINLLDEVIGANWAAYTPCLQQTDALLGALVAGIPGSPVPQRQTATGVETQKRRRVGRRWVLSWVPVISGSWGGTFRNWNATRAQFGAGRITDARRAAEYIHIFVSDHLPLVATIPSP